MNEILYNQSSLLIACILFLAMAAAIELGYRIGCNSSQTFSKGSKEHINAIQSSLLGVMALLLGFTFSLALQRFDSRSVALVDEANAIGTAYLRAQLLPDSVRGEARRLMQNYIELRVKAGAISLPQDAERSALSLKTNSTLDALWRISRKAAEVSNSPVTTGLFIQSLNETIDSYGRHDAAIARHVPEVIFFLLYSTFLLSAGVIGYGAGVAGHRPALVSYTLVALIVILSFIIIDLDRPRRGLITVDQSSLTQLKAAIDAAQTLGSQQTLPTSSPRPAVTGRD